RHKANIAKWVDGGKWVFHVCKNTPRGVFLRGVTPIGAFLRGVLQLSQSIIKLKPLKKFLSNMITNILSL
ncbi:MAG: hypothetical protein ACK53Y_22170, partial [bacterium]